MTTAQTAAHDPALLPLARLLDLARRARDAASAAQLAYMAVNESRDLVAYRQAVLWQEGRKVIALSGVVAPEANSPYLLWLERLLRRFASAEFSGLPALALDAADVDGELSAEWAEWLPAHALWLPYQTKGLQGGWLLARDDAWQDEEIALLKEWQASWAQSWALAHTSLAAQGNWRCFLVWWSAARQRLRQPGAMRAGGRWLWRTAAGRWTLALIFVLALPVRLSVLAPGQLVPAHPSVIRSPLDGIVDRILVQPNQAVEAGTPLIEFDRISLASRLEVAQQALATAETEYRQFAQQAVTEAKSKGQMAALQGRIEEKRADIAYLDALNQRAALISPRAGIALLDEPSEWVGRPVNTGERIMVIAEEDDAEIEAWLAPGDLIDFPPQAAVTIYLNTRPLSPLEGQLRYLAHEAQPQAEGGYAYRVRATLAAGETAPRIGLKGTVKLRGPWVPLAYWVLRKPLAVVRGLIGL